MQFAFIWFSGNSDLLQRKSWNFIWCQLWAIWFLMQAEGFDRFFLLLFFFPFLRFFGLFITILTVPSIKYISMYEYTGGEVIFYFFWWSNYRELVDDLDSSLDMGTFWHLLLETLSIWLMLRQTQSLTGWRWVICKMNMSSFLYFSFSLSLCINSFFSLLYIYRDIWAMCAPYVGIPVENILPLWVKIVQEYGQSPQAEGASINCCPLALLSSHAHFILVILNSPSLAWIRYKITTAYIFSLQTLFVNYSISIFLVDRDKDSQCTCAARSQHT